MLRIRRLLIICIIPAILFLLAAHTVTVASQPPEDLQPRFNRALALVHEAEVAGATREEVSDLVLLLNQALQLSEEATRLPASEAQRRAELLAKMDETLATVETKASQLEVVVSQRTFVSRVIAYASGGIAAFVGTLAYAYGVRLWRKYRIKRTFQMRIFPK